MKQKARIIHIKTGSKQCQLHQRIARFALDLNDLPDAAEVKKQKLRSAPLALLEMVF